MTVLAEVVRNGLVESVHGGTAVVLDPQGRVQHAVGEVEAPVYGRSSNKPLQGVAMLEQGLALDGRHLAVAVASHSAEPFHLQAVNEILARSGLTVEDLQCIVDPPLAPEVARRLWQSGGSASRLTMNCSGKHAAMLATCNAQGWDQQSYCAVHHPLTGHITDAMHRLSGARPSHIGIDGCGAPAHVMTVAALARAFGAIAVGPPGSAEHKVATAMRNHPEFVAGTGRDDTVLMNLIPGLICKEGADGVHAAALPDGSAVALKIADGATRPRLPVMVRLLEFAGADVSALAEIRRPTIFGGGKPVGEIRCVL